MFLGLKDCWEFCVSKRPRIKCGGIRTGGHRGCEAAEAEAGEDTEAAQRAIEQECLPWECSWGDGGYCNVKPKIQYLAAIQLGLKGDTKKQVMTIYVKRRPRIKCGAEAKAGEDTEAVQRAIEQDLKVIQRNKVMTIYVKRRYRLPLRSLTTLYVAFPHNDGANRKLDSTCEDKGKMIVTEPEITAITDLRPIFCNKRIEAVVYSKWTSKHVHTQQPMKYCCILMDKQSYQNTFALSSSTTIFDFPSFHQKS
nr:hypothetical protein [Tanacetum cinerariifolium]